MAQTGRPIVLISGSSGLIGDAVVRRLVAGYDVIGLDLVPPRQPVEGAGWIRMDMGDDAGVAAAFEQVRRDHTARIASVIHLAAYYDFSGEPSDKYEKVTVRGTERLLRAVRPFNPDQFIFSSTMLVHAPTEPGRPIDEDAPVQPSWDYPRSKVDAEAVIRRERGSISTVMMRIAGVYDDQCHSIPIAQQIKRIYERQLHGRVFPGDISHGQSFIHLDDLVEAIALAVDRRRDLPAETVLLVGEPDTSSYDELQQTLSRLIHGEALQTRPIPKALARAGAWIEEKAPLAEEPFIKSWMIDLADDHYELDISRARQLLGWEPKRSLRDTLPRMVGFLKSDPAGFYRENKLPMPRGMERDEVDKRQ